MPAIHDVNDREEIIPEPVPELEGFYYYPDDKDIVLSKEGMVGVLSTNFFTFPKANNHKHRLVVTLPKFLNSKEDYSPLVKKWTTYSYHRLLARTFVGRPNIYKYVPHELLQVNHINLNSLDNEINNLEWCTPKENNQHSFNGSNSKQQKKVIIKNLDNQEIKEFRSITLASQSIGLDKGTMIRTFQNTEGGFRF